MPRPPARRPTRLAIALARLEEDRDGLARAWLLRTLERRPLAELERIPLGRLAGELPRLVEAVTGALAGTGAPLDGREWLARLAAVPRPARPSGAEVAEDLAALESVLLGALVRELADEPDLLADALAGVARTLAVLHGPALGALMAGRAGEATAGDPVTGLSRAGALRERLGQLAALHERHGRPFALLVLGVEGLDRVGDARGPAAADRVLARVARAVEARVRRLDLVARLGDDQLGVLLPEQLAPGARAVAERLARAVEAAEPPGREGAGVSVGVAACPEHATEPGALLELADEALYRARARGRAVEAGPSDK